MKSLLFLFISLIVFTGNSYSQSDDDIISPQKKATLSPEIIGISYKNKIYVKFIHDIKTDTSSGNLYSLDLISHERYPCMNYEIISNVDTSGRKIIVTLYGIKTPVVCLSATGPAAAQHSMELKNGNYLLLLRYEGIVDSYKVRIRNDKIYLKEDRVEFTGKWKGS
jgi:hypothetical protein